MSLDDLAFASASELRPLIDSRQVSILELTEMLLRRIERLNPNLNAYLTITRKEALTSARAAEKALLQGENNGPLHGIPISIKDLELTQGIRTTLGSLVYKDHVPDQDTIVVERVRKSGAIILGKTNTPEFGFSGTTENRLGDACRNPWNTSRTSGGSSGGAAVGIAAGLCTVATGSDGGGSIRIPSNFCGVYGIKPSQGRVPRHGGVGRPAYNCLSQSGPITRTVRDSAVLLQALAGPDSRDSNCIKSAPPDFVTALDQGVNGLRLGWSADLGYAAVDPEVAETASKAALLFEDLGCMVEESGIALDDPFPPFWDLFGITGFTAYGHLLDSHRQDLAEGSIRAMERGKIKSGADYSRAMVYVSRLKARMGALFEQYDLLLTPTTAVPAFPVGEPPAIIGGHPVIPFWGYTPFTFVFNMTMQPAASIPCGFSSDGMPIGLHIIGRKGEETTVLRASAAFESARPWAQKRPPIT